MKKLRILLGVLLTFCFTNVSFAEPLYLEPIGATIDVPKGTIMQDGSDENDYMFALFMDGREDIVYVLAVNYDEVYEGDYLDDGLSEEAFAEISTAFANAVPDPKAELLTKDGAHYLQLTSGDGTQVQYIQFMDGWVVIVAVVNREGKQLVAKEIDLCLTIMQSIAYDE